jgi:hypothetical protein
LPGYDGKQLYVGDIHNHCGISYGHGTIEDAYANARMQLDFASVTGHAHWHDIPRVPGMEAAVAYHEAGFARLAGCWDHVQQVTEDVHEDGRFVSFLSFEWHSSTYGDYCVYVDGARGDIIRADDLEGLRVELRHRIGRGARMMMLPHHIGYPRGYRGANWDAFTEELSPIVEMVSMHGCAESDDAPRPYLHAMGPRCGESTALHGLRRGHRFGMIGSTDHHSAHPGSYGHGRVAAWASELTRPGIWDAFEARSVYALTGDPIVVGFSVDEAPMGSSLARTTRPRLRADVTGATAVDYVDVIRNGELIHRVNHAARRPSSAFDGTVGFAVGWGVREPTAWTSRIRITGGRLVDVTPRLRGEDILKPADDEPTLYRLSDWGRSTDEVWLTTRTSPNGNQVTDGTQGLLLHIEGDDRTAIAATVNGIDVEHRIGELREGSVAHYLRPTISPAFRFERAVDRAELSATVDLTDELPADASVADFYYLRIRQTNDQWAWTSPVWVESA